MALEIRSVEPGIGVEAAGVNLATISDADFKTLHAAFLASNVLVVRDQRFTIEEFLNYSRRFGRPVPHITKKTRHPQYPELTVMGYDPQSDMTPTAAVRTDKDKKAVLSRGEGWHTDTPYLVEPAIATQLYALKIPSYGGDTLFANMYAAYAALPEALKKRIEGLKASFRAGGKDQKSKDLLDAEELKRPPAIHPIAPVHPETGRKSLYVNPYHIIGIEGMDEKESDALLAELFTYMFQPGCQYRHKWRVGDVVIWDNRCSIHSAAGGYSIDEPRVHWRTTIMAAKKASPQAAAAE